ncbi:hypothetical protein H0H93_010609, partial [Arthromyces matolae]
YALAENENQLLRKQNESLRTKLSRQEEELQLNHDKSVNKIGGLQGQVQRLLAEQENLYKRIHDHSQEWLRGHAEQKEAEALMEEERARHRRESKLAAVLEKAMANNDNKSLEILEQYTVSICVDHFIRSLIKVSKEMEKELQREMRLNVEKHKALQDKVDELEGKENKTERLQEDLKVFFYLPPSGEELKTADTQEYEEKNHQLTTLLQKERVMAQNWHARRIEEETASKTSLTALRVQLADQARKLEALKTDFYDRTAISAAAIELAEKDKQISALTTQMERLFGATNRDINSLVQEYEGRLKQLQVERDELSRKCAESENEVNKLCKEKEAEAEKFCELEEEVEVQRDNIWELKLENKVNELCQEKEAVAQKSRELVAKLERQVERERDIAQELANKAKELLHEKEAEAQKYLERASKLEQQVVVQRDNVWELENKVDELLHGKEAETQKSRELAAKLEQVRDPPRMSANVQTFITFYLRSKL